MSGNAGYDPLASVGSSQPSPVTELRIRMAAPIMGAEELAAVKQVLESGILTNGPWTRRFEDAMAQWHGTEHAVAFANGTVALAAMLLAEGIGPGDEVVVPSLTFIATATSVLHVGATPVFADIRPDSFNLDPDDVLRRIGPRTRAIMPVHYAGQPADMDRFGEIASDAGLNLFEDAAQAHGASFKGRPVGGWSDSAMFSFTPTKNITTGEGSVVTTNDADVAQRLRLLRNHGMDAPYHHAIVGYNWRLSEMHSAIGCCQLDRLEAILAKKRSNAKLLADLFDGMQGVTVPVELPDRTHPFMIYTVTFDQAVVRDRAAAALADAGIETRLYFPPAHRQPIFVDLKHHPLPVTDDVSARILSLPFHSRLDAADFEQLVSVIADALTT